MFDLNLRTLTKNVRRNRMSMVSWRQNDVEMMSWCIGLNLEVILTIYVWSWNLVHLLKTSQEIEWTCSREVKITSWRRNDASWRIGLILEETLTIYVWSWNLVHLLKMHEKSNEGGLRASVSWHQNDVLM